MHTSNYNTQQYFSHDIKYYLNTNEVNIYTILWYWEVFMEKDHLSSILKYAHNLDRSRCSGATIFQMKKLV